MGNEQKIIEKIIEDAKFEAEEIINKAAAEAGEITNVALDKANKELEALSALSVAEADKAFAKEVSSAEMRAKKMILSTKQEILEIAISKAADKLFGLSREEYEDVILEMLKKASPSDGSEVILSKKDAEAIGSAVTAAGFTLSQDNRPISAGFIIKKGDIEYNYAFDAIIAVEKEDIEQAAAKILFG